MFPPGCGNKNGEIVIRGVVLGLAIVLAVSGGRVVQAADVGVKALDAGILQTGAITVAEAERDLPVRPAALLPLPADADEEVLPVQGRFQRSATVERGDTLLEILLRAGVVRQEVDDALTAMAEVFDIRKIKVGQSVAVLFEYRDGVPRFQGFAIEPDPVHTVTVYRGEGRSFTAEQSERAVERRLVAASGTVHASLYEAAVTAGVPVPVIMAMIRTYSYDVDFQRDLQPGDRFEMLFERYLTDRGTVAREGELLYASLTLGGKTKPLYRFAQRDGKVDYFNRLGESVKRALLRTPVDGARLTSRFGARKHPILGYTKMHKGLDFGAPSGSPIYAAGHGVVDEAGRKGPYGNYIRIRHNSEVSTAYAHMSRFARNMRRGMRISQGEVIGFVGSTGRSTGPHLHYEILKNNAQVNPLTVNLPTGQKLEGAEWHAFLKTVQTADKAYAEAMTPKQMVERPQH